MKTAIEVQNLTVGYDGKAIIQNLSLQIPQGKISIIIGPNGCGKSTLLKTMARILKPSQGEVWLKGQNLAQSQTKWIAQHMAVLPQSPLAPEGIKVKELVAFGRFPYQRPMAGLSKEDVDIIHKAMAQTGTLDFAEKSVQALSGGQRQRVWIAMVLAQQTDVLLLDEPTTYLDLANQLEILNLVKQLNQEQGTTVVIVMHEINNAIKFAHHLIGIKQGEILFEGKPCDVITQSNLRNLYDISATLTTSPHGTYPAILDYELA